MSMQTLKKVARDYRRLSAREREKLETGIGTVQYTITLRRTHKPLSGYELDSMDGRVGMVTCELLSVEQRRGKRGQLPHQIVTSLRGLRPGLSPERRVQNFFRAIAQLKGCRVVELEAEVVQRKEAVVQRKEVEVAQRKEVEVAQRKEAVVQRKEVEVAQRKEAVVQKEEAPAIKRPSDEDVPDSWDDSDED